MVDHTLPFRQSGDILLILPPFAEVNRPSLGLTLLQQIAAEEGLSCEIYYATLHLARAFDEKIYIAAAIETNGLPLGLPLLGERLFSSFAFPELEFDNRIYAEYEAKHRHGLPAGQSRFPALEATIGVWLEEFRQLIKQLDFRVFGLSTMFSQNLCCVCLARIIKEEKPNSLVLIGGANCDGGMARGIATLSSCFDHIFVGEAEATFRTFCQNLQDNGAPTERLIVGSPTSDLNQLTCPDFQGYFTQLSFFLPNSRLLKENRIVIPYETSRGCWWGQKHHCTFCGLNANGMAFRTKDGAKVLADLRLLRERHGRRPINMTDNIMPMQYFDTLLPAIIREGLDLDMFYEEKSNLNYQQLRIMKAAGVNEIQAGIEALSTSLLRRMRKGVTGAQNIRLLRDCRSLGIITRWNLLFNFPGDADVDYEETFSLIQKIRHLMPPHEFSPVNFDRFSPYFREPETFGIRNLRPLDGYSRVYPSHLATEDLAYHFVGDADVVSERNSALVKLVSDEVQTWIADWQARNPTLSVSRFASGEYVVYDTRREGNPSVQIISRTMAALITNQANAVSEEVQQAIAHDWVVDIDRLYVGLAVASPQDVLELRGGLKTEGGRETAEDPEGLSFEAKALLDELA